MTIRLTGETRYDTRGLPEGYDPHKLYEYRYETLVKNATGFESFLYKYIPFSVIKSFAFAIDPTAPFKVAPGTITPANRVKWRQTASVLLVRSYRQTRNRITWAQPVNYGGFSACWGPNLLYTDASPPALSGGLRTQAPVVDYLKDTTKRTRLVGSKQGELEMFKSFIFSPARTVRSSESDKTTYPQTGGSPTGGCAAIGGGENREAGGFDRREETQGPLGSTLPKAYMDAYRSQEIARCKALCAKHAIRLLKSWSPDNRDYTLFRNVVELKDIPRSILSLQQTLVDFKKLFVSLGTQPKLRSSIFELRNAARNIPSEYLSYHFGWKQTYNDVMDLLLLPNKLAKKFNFYADRAGKPTTFRRKYQEVTAESGVSGFEYDVSGLEFWSGPLLESRIVRESEVRLVINATFDFPPLNTPQFRVKEFLNRIGALPRPTDIYNLIPWTWLLDYFTGFGNYVELIDNINHDRSLINWGMISCRTHGKLITEYRSKSADVTSNTIFNVGQTITTIIRDNPHTSVWDFECQTRSDVAQILSVNTTLMPNTLSAYQKSIIGALLAQRSEFLRGGHFRPHS
jgi:hypothetical protein